MKTEKCSKCGEMFDHAGPKTRSYCPPCKSTYNRAWREGNEAFRETKRRWRQANAEHVRAKKRESWHRNAEDTNARLRKRRSDHPEVYRVYAERKRARDKELGRGHYYRHGITLAQRDHLMETQGSRCALCQKDLANLTGRSVCVDHDHATGLIRGILCAPCNARLGWFEGRADTVIAYLAKDHMVPEKWVKRPERKVAEPIIVPGVPDPYSTHPRGRVKRDNSAEG